jgi:hypothetical protein
VSPDADVPALGEIAPSEAKEIDHDHAMTGRNMRHDILPKMRRGRKAVQEEDGISLAARARGVVVQPRAGEVEELASHKNDEE